MVPLVSEGTTGVLLYVWIFLLFWIVVLGALTAFFLHTCTYRDADTADRARAILTRGGSTLSYMSTWPGNQYWISNGGQAASYINGQFMNSPDHRSNILNGNYTDLGVGSAVSAPGVNWTGAGSPGYQNVWMFSEEFAQLHGSAPPPPPPPRSSNPPRNSPGPAAPGQPPATTAPTPAPTPVPTPTPTPIPSGLLPAIAPPPPSYQYQGLLAGSIESVLEAFLIP